MTTETTYTFSDDGTHIVGSNGETLILTFSPFISEDTLYPNCFEAIAENAFRIEDGDLIATYRIIWQILPDWNGEDGANACNWDVFEIIEL